MGKLAQQLSDQSQVKVAPGKGMSKSATPTKGGNASCKCMGGLVKGKGKK